MYLIREAVKASGLSVLVHVAKDGEEATRFLDEADRDSTAPCPQFVILDINLPKKPGLVVLAHVRHSRRCPNACVIVVSSSRNVAEQETFLTNGANAFFSKPSDYDAFLKLGDLLRARFLADGKD